MSLLKISKVHKIYGLIIILIIFLLSTTTLGKDSPKKDNDTKHVNNGISSEQSTTSNITKKDVKKRHGNVIQEQAMGSESSHQNQVTIIGGGNNTNTGGGSNDADGSVAGGGQTNTVDAQGNDDESDDEENDEDGPVVTTIAGEIITSGTSDGKGRAARFNLSTALTTDGSNLYIVDTYSHTIRKLVISTREVSTLAGIPGISGSTDGIGASALFHYPHGIATDGTNLYVADSINSTIRKIVISTGEVTTFAGVAGTCGQTDGVGPAARFCVPFGITTDGTHLYVADTWNATIRKIVIATGEVTTLAGAPLTQGSTDGVGAAARFNYSTSIVTDGTYLYAVDSGSNTIRKIVISTGAVTTMAGAAGVSGSTDGKGNEALFYYPQAIAVHKNKLFITDNGNLTVRRIVIPSSTNDQPGNGRSDNQQGQPNGQNGDKDRNEDSDKETGQGHNDNQQGGGRNIGDHGNGHSEASKSTEKTDTIHQVIVSTWAGAAGLPGSDDGSAVAARFFSPHGIAVDGTTLYVSDMGAIRKIH